MMWLSQQPDIILLSIGHWKASSDQDPVVLSNDAWSSFIYRQQQSAQTAIFGSLDDLIVSHFQLSNLVELFPPSCATIAFGSYAIHQYRCTSKDARIGGDHRENTRSPRRKAEVPSNLHELRRCRVLVDWGSYDTSPDIHQPYRGRIHRLDVSSPSPSLSLQATQQDPVPASCTASLFTSHHKYIYRLHEDTDQISAIKGASKKAKINSEVNANSIGRANDREDPDTIRGKSLGGLLSSVCLPLYKVI
jgi:hypothetical protein